MEGGVRPGTTLDEGGLLHSDGGRSVEVTWVDQGDTGEAAREAATAPGIRPVVVKLEEAKGGFVLLRRRWVVERCLAWAFRFRRLAKDHERLSETLLAYQVFACALLMLAKVALTVQRS